MEKPRRETARGRKTRESIMEAATALVCERGYAGTSVDMVCKRASVVKTAVYWHFGSKAGLMAALVDSANDLWIDTIEAQIKAQKTPEARLESLLDTLRLVITTRSQLLRLVEVVISESGNMDPEVVEAVSRLHMRTMDAIANGFNDSLGFELKSGRMLAHTITSLMHGIHRHYLLYGEGIDLDVFFDDMRHTIRASIAERIQRQS